jgi:hypothetical protein
MKLIPQEENFFKHEYVELEAEYKIPTKSLLMYEGYLTDEPSTSFASGSIIDGKFFGFVATKTEKYFIEPIKRFDPETNDTNEHSLIYKEKDIKLSNRTRRSNKNDIETIYSEFNDEIETENAQVGCGAADKRIAEQLEQQQDLFRKSKEVS